MMSGLDGRGRWVNARRSAFRRLRRLPIVSLVVIGAFTAAAACAPLLPLPNPISGHLSARLIPPLWQSEGSWHYPLGTDAVGRDLLSRIVFGARTSLLVAGLSLLIGGTLGSLVGMAAGYFGGAVDAALMRLADITNGFPVVLVALLLAVTFGPSMGTVLVSTCFMLWARFAQVVRADVLSLRDREYVKSAFAIGCSRSRILVRHILPNVTNTIIVVASLQISWVILVEASLGFLGAGVPPPTADWGTMVADGREYVLEAYWVATMPGLAIMLTVLAFSLLGDWLRDVLDPKLRSI